MTEPLTADDLHACAAALTGERTLNDDALAVLLGKLERAADADAPATFSIPNTTGSEQHLTLPLADGLDVVALEDDMPGLGYRLAFERFRDSGLLWLLNASVLHPRGFALGFTYPAGADIAQIKLGQVEPSGWTIYGDGTDAWRFDEHTSDDGFRNWTVFHELLLEVCPTTHLRLEYQEADEGRGPEATS